MRVRVAVVWVALLMAGASALAADSVPRGWVMAGSEPKAYRAGVENDGSAYLMSAPSETPKGFGTLMQTINAQQYVGKRVRLRASVRAENVAGWAGLWMRVDEQSHAVGFDNMQDRPIKGTSGWMTYDVVLDVPEGATAIAFGTLMNSTGEVWLKDVQFEVVGTDVATTGKGIASQTLPKEPVNLNFTR